MAALLLATAACAAMAHDSWLEFAAASGRGADALVAFRTGARYPVAESAPAPASVARALCRDGSGRLHALHPRPPRHGASALRLDPPAGLHGPRACWAELTAHEVALEADLVETYLREIRPGDALRGAWAGMQARGQPWRERYRKFARIEPSGQDLDAATLRALRQEAGLALEIVVLGDRPLRSGLPALFQVLADGKPLAGLAVELVSERSPVGIWAHSDAQGQIAHRLPFGGSWLLRATWLQPPEQGLWHSRFVTLAFEVR